jgi:hypothetical protein
MVAALAAGGGVANVFAYLAAHVSEWLPGASNAEVVVIVTILTFAARITQRYFQGVPKPGKDITVKSKPFTRFGAVLIAFVGLSSLAAAPADAQCVDGSCAAPAIGVYAGPIFAAPVVPIYAGPIFAAPAYAAPAYASPALRVRQSVKATVKVRVDAFHGGAFRGSFREVSRRFDRAVGRPCGG